MFTADLALSSFSPKKCEAHYTGGRFKDRNTMYVRKGPFAPVEPGVVSPPRRMFLHPGQPDIQSQGSLLFGCVYAMGIYGLDILFCIVYMCITTSITQEQKFDSTRLRPQRFDEKLPYCLIREASRKAGPKGFAAAYTTTIH